MSALSVGRRMMIRGTDRASARAGFAMLGSIVVVLMSLVSSVAAQPTSDAPKKPVDGSSESPTLSPLPSKESAGETSPVDPLTRGVSDLLGDLDFFPYVIVVPPEDVRRFEEESFVILPKRSVDAWLDARMAEQDARSAGSVSSVELRVVLDRDPAHVKATIGIRVDASDGVRIPLGFADAMVVDASIQELVASSQPEGGVRRSEAWIPSLSVGEDGYEVLIARPGNYELQLSLRADVQLSPAERTLRMSPPAAPVRRVDLISDRPLANLRNLGSADEVVLADDRRSARSVITAGTTLVFAWRFDQPSLDRSVFSSADRVIQIRVDDRSLEMDRDLEIDAPFDISSCTFSIPSSEVDVQVLPIQHEQIVPHSLRTMTEDSRHKITVNFGRSISGLFRVRILSRRSFEQGAPVTDVGNVIVDGAVQQSGTILLSWSPRVWVRAEPTGGGKRLSLQELAESEQARQPRQAYRVTGGEVGLVLHVEPARPLLVATADSDLTVGAESMSMTTQFEIGARGAQVDQFMIHVPAAMQEIEGFPTQVVRLTELPIDPDSTTRAIQVTLAEPVEDGKMQWTLQGRLPATVGDKMRVDVPTLAETPLVQGTLTVRAEPTVQPILDDTGTEYLRRAPIPEDDDAIPTAFWHFRLQPGPARISFRVEAVVTEVEADVETWMTRTDQAVEVQTFLEYRTRYSSFSEITLTIPEGIKDVRISGDVLTDSITTEPGTVTGRLSNPVTTTNIQATYRVPISSSQQSQAELPLVLPHRERVTNWRGHVFCPRGLRAEAIAPWRTRRPAVGDLVDLNERAVAEIDPPPTGQPLLMLPLRFEPTASLALLVVPRVWIEEVCVDDGSRWGRKHWLIAKHRIRDARLRLPIGARLREAFVDGQSVDVASADEQVVEIRLPAMDDVCTLEVDYDFPNQRPVGALGFGTMESPTLVDEAAVEEVRWSYRVPQDRLMLRWNSAGHQTSDWWRLERFFEPPREPGWSWLRAPQTSVAWAPVRPSAMSGRLWTFDGFREDGSIRLILVREPFWVLVSSGTALILILALARLSTAMQIRLGAVTVLAIVGLLAVLPEMLAWLWLGARWGIGVGLITVLLTRWWRRRRLRAYNVGLRRFNDRQRGLGSAILKQLEPRTRITSGSATRSVEPR